MKKGIKDIVGIAMFLLLVWFAVGFGLDSETAGNADGTYTIKFAHVANPTVAKGRAAERFAVSPRPNYLLISFLASLTVHKRPKRTCT